MGSVAVHVLQGVVMLLMWMTGFNNILGGGAWQTGKSNQIESQIKETNIQKGGRNLTTPAKLLIGV